VKKLAPIVLLILLLCVASATAEPPMAASHHATPWGNGPAYVPGEVMVKFKPGAGSSARSRALTGVRARVKQTLPETGDRVLSIPKGASVEDALAELRNDPAVAWAEPNSIVKGGSVPNDARFGEQWGLQNTGKPVDGVPGTPGDDIHAVQAWDRTTGSPNVTVAVIDSGVNFAEPDLKPNIWANPGESGGDHGYNGVDDDGNGFVDDVYGWDFVQQDSYPSDNWAHGTHVAGIIGAKQNNGIGISGVAPNTTIMPLRVLDNAGMGSCNGEAAAIAYAGSMGARVANISIWSPYRCTAAEDAIAASPNTLFVVIAGNDDGVNVDESPRYPCSDPEPNVVCVTATDANDHIASFANVGKNSVDLAAPGVAILSTWLKWQDPQILFSEDFEPPIASGWLTGGTSPWQLTTAQHHSGSWSITDSAGGNYANNTNNYLALTGLDLSAERDCWANFYLTSLWGTGDDQLLEWSKSDRQPWSADASLSDNLPVFTKQYADLGRVDGDSNADLEFNLVTDGSGVNDGVNIDDFEVKCQPPATNFTGASDEFDYDDGTSMAAPFVSGVAALVLSVDPSMSTAALKQRILSTVDPVPGLAGVTATGGRLDAARAVDLSQPPGGAGPGGGGSAQPRRGPLARDLAAIRKVLGRAGVRRKLLRTGKLKVSLHPLAAGRYTLTLRATVGTIARGSHASKRAGRLPLTLRLTGPGRRALRKAAGLRVTVALRFVPKAGAATSGSARVRLR
jgi:subtilisin family serine protease